MKQLFLSILLFLTLLNLAAQEQLEFGGYVKLLPSMTLFRPLESSVNDNLIHNRLNLKWYPHEAFTVGLGVRSRLFWGDQTRLNPFYATTIDNDNGWMDLSHLWVEDTRVVIHSIVDRVWVNWQKGKWELRLGRQRINWGINTVWNPNDLFNQYSYFDFDYEERPGADAIRLQYFKDYTTSFELAYSPQESVKESVGAVLVKTNRWNYDFQFLGAYFKDDLVLGGGWAGNIGQGGFKGELSYFSPMDRDESEEAFVASLAGDYSFSKVYLQVSVLHNSQGEEELDLFDPGLLGFFTPGSQELSAKAPLPLENVVFTQVSYTIGPLSSIDLATMFTPTIKNLILIPSLSHSLASNTDFLLTAQIFSQNQEKQLLHISSAVFARVKWSF